MPWPQAPLIRLSGWHWAGRHQSKGLCGPVSLTAAQPPGEGVEDRTGMELMWTQRFSLACSMTGGGRFLAPFSSTGSISHPPCVAVYLDALHWALIKFRDAFWGSQNKASSELGRHNVVSEGGRMVICWAEQCFNVLQTVHGRHYFVEVSCRQFC